MLYRTPDSSGAGLDSNLLTSALGYLIDAAQRQVLFMDAMRERGNQYLEHCAKAVPHVLNYQAELILDGRTLPRPVNYGLARIIPPKGIEIDPVQRPFVIVDPRGGARPRHRRF